MAVRWFSRTNYSADAAEARAQQIPGDLWVKCSQCGAMLYRKEFESNLKVCEKCGYHSRLSARERIVITVDPDSFVERDTGLLPADPLHFPEYAEKLAKAQKATGLVDAAVVGEASVEGYPFALAVTDFHFMAGSMGSVVGEKVVRTFERATERSLPVVVISCSGGGARMHEGILSLMQMAKTSAAVAKLAKARLPYITVLADHSMAGVQASFASLGDVIMAEPGAIIGFTGQRVIEQNLKIKLPKGFQSSEFQLSHGMIDMIVQRKEVRPTLARLLEFFCG